MNNPATAEVWQTGFSQDFGGMAQGCDKTCQKGTNAMFVMTHKEITHALRNGTKFSYANPFVDYWPPKKHPNGICIMAGGNLILYNSKLSVCRAEVRTLKDGYLRKVPLPRVPRGQSTIPVAATATFPVNPHNTSYLTDPMIPLYNNLTRLLLDVSRLCLLVRHVG